MKHNSMSMLLNILSQMLFHTCKIESNYLGQEGSYDASLRLFVGSIDDVIVYEHTIGTTQIATI